MVTPDSPNRALVVVVLVPVEVLYDCSAEGDVIAEELEPGKFEAKHGAIESEKVDEVIAFGDSIGM